jgi:RNA polymerase sigma factor (sigma-70 family)
MEKRFMQDHAKPIKGVRKRRPYVMAAVVLGTALSAFGSTQAASPVSGPTIDNLTRYCTACWRNARIDPDQWTDCTQDVFCRLLDRVTLDRWNDMLKVEGEDRREFLRAIDAVKKKSQRARRHVYGMTESLADGHGTYEQDLQEKREAIERASGNLNPRQRAIIGYSFDGWTVHEISKKLLIPVERVSDEKYKAIQKLRTALQV